MSTNNQNQNDIDTNFSRRSFLRQKATVATSAAFYGFFVSLDDNHHASNCQCSVCQDGVVSSADSVVDNHGVSCQCNNCVSAIVGDNHDTSCQCGSCMRLNLGPLAANAYERDVGDENRSPETYAMNLQAKKTNARLEASGFKLDTKEEEASRLSDAMGSFSYDDSMSKRKTFSSDKNGGKGYKTNKNVDDDRKM